MFTYFQILTMTTGRCSVGAEAAGDVGPSFVVHFQSERRKQVACGLGAKKWHVVE